MSAADMLGLTVEQLNLSIRTLYAVKRAGINTVSDFIDHADKMMSSNPRTYAETMRILKELDKEET